MTRRQQIIEILEKQKSTAQHLANVFETTLKEILEDLAVKDGALRTKIDAAIEEYRSGKQYQVKYGRAVQLELFAAAGK